MNEKQMLSAVGLCLQPGGIHRIVVKGKWQVPGGAFRPPHPLPYPPVASPTRSLRACDHSLRLPLLAVRLRRLGDSERGTQGQAEAEGVAADARRASVTVRRLAIRGNVAPTAATVHAVRAHFWARRIPDGTLGVVTVPVAAPFPNISMHVV